MTRKKDEKPRSETMIRLNTMSPVFDHGRIACDFRIYMVKKEKEGWYGSEAMDRIRSGGGEIGVCYSHAKDPAFYVICRKGGLTRAEAGEAAGSTDCTVSEISSSELCARPFGVKILTSLFFNLLNGSDAEDASCLCNLTGRLYHVDAARMNAERISGQVEEIAVRQSGDVLTLSVHAKAMCRRSYFDGSAKADALDRLPGYAIREGRLVRLSKQEMKALHGDYYIFRAANPHRKAGLAYFSFGNSADLMRCRAGLAAKYVMRLEAKYGSYIQLHYGQDFSFTDINTEKQVRISQEKLMESCVAVLNAGNGKGIAVTDLVWDETSALAAGSIRDWFDLAVGKPGGSPAGEIRIIHEAGAEGPDLHIKKAEYPVQHVTVEMLAGYIVKTKKDREESGKKTLDAAGVKTLCMKFLQELAIKSDIARGTVTLAVPPSESMLFIMKVSGGRSGDKDAFHGLMVKPDGTLEPRLHLEAGGSLSDQDAVYDYSAAEERVFSTYLNGVVITPSASYAVTATTKTPIPDVWACHKQLTDAERMVDICEVADLADEYAATCEDKNAEYILNVFVPRLRSEALVSGGRRRARDLFLNKEYKLYLSNFCAWYGTRTGSVLKATLKGKEIMKPFQHVCMRNAEDAVEYFSGMNAVPSRYTVSKAKVVRRISVISGEESEADIGMLMEMLCVPFVKTASDNTVLPYPFKYLRELILQDADEHGIVISEEADGQLVMGLQLT